MPSAAAGASDATEAVIAEPTVLEASGALATVGAPGNSADLTVVWLGAAIAVPWFGWRVLDGVLDRRRRASFVMRHFADRFVREFERPLIQQHAAEHPVRVRFRSRRFGRRIDILLAPGTSRRYPNLSDHKQNVEYRRDPRAAGARRRINRARPAPCARGVGRGAVSLQEGRSDTQGVTCKSSF